MSKSGGYRRFLAALLLIAGSIGSGRAFGAQASGNNIGAVLPISPISASVLVARAVHTGLIQPQSAGRSSNAAPQLTCTPAPCALPNVQASGGGQPVNEDPIAVNPKNALQLLSGGNDYNCPNIQGFYSSGNGGTSWLSTCLNNLSGQFGEGDPIVGYDRKGNSYIGGIDSPNGSTGEIVFEKSSNNGATWSAPSIAVNPFFSGGLTDKPWLQIDTTATSPHVNALYMSVTQFDVSSNSTITVSHSTNGGTTWSGAIQVDTTQIYPNVDQFSDIAIGKDGTVYVSWMRCLATGPTGDCGGTTAMMEVSKSTDGGNTWSLPVPIATPALAPDTCSAFYGCVPNSSERVSNVPAIGIDNSTGPNAGHLYVVMYTWTGVYLKVEVYRSSNGGATWSLAGNVAPTSDTHDQFFPWLSVGSKGKVGVTWLDRRNDPSNVSYEAFGTYSTNGGSTFKPNLQLATVASNPNNDGFGGGFMGDYTGNTWTGITLYASWMDTRNGSTAQDEVGGLLK